VKKDALWKRFLRRFHRYIKAEAISKESYAQMKNLDVSEQGWFCIEAF
jgi:hypothetical protein